MADEEKKFKVTIGPEKHPPVRSGIYSAKLLEVAGGAGFKGQPIFNIVFEILNGEYRGRKVIGKINQSSNGVHGRLWQLHQAMAEEGLKVTAEFYMGDLIGRECFINVEQRGGFNAITEFIHPKHLKDIERFGFSA